MTDSSDLMDVHPLFRDYQDELAREDVRKSRQLARKQIRDRILGHTAPPWPMQTLRDDPQPQTRRRASMAITPPAQPIAPSEQDEDIFNLQAELEERERYLRRARAIVENQQRALQEQEMLLQMREKYLQEKTELLAAREKRITASKGQGEASAVSGLAPKEAPRDISDEERASFERLREELDRREQSLESREKLLREREGFIEESETTLFEKAQELQEREEELAALADALESRRLKLDAREGIENPKEKL